MEERLINFAVRIVRLARSLPENAPGRYLAQQVLRAGTSPAPRYSTRQRAVDRSVFIQEMGVILCCLKETSIWLRMIERSEMIPKEALAALSRECNELCRVFGASIQTARVNGQSSTQNQGFSAPG